MNIAIDIREFAPNPDAIFPPAGMTEKTGLLPGQIVPNQVEDSLRSFRDVPEYVYAQEIARLAAEQAERSQDPPITTADAEPERTEADRSQAMDERSGSVPKAAAAAE